MKRNAYRGRPRSDDVRRFVALLASGRAGRRIAVPTLIEEMKKAGYSIGRVGISRHISTLHGARRIRVHEGTLRTTATWRTILCPIFGREIYIGHVSLP